MAAMQSGIVDPNPHAPPAPSPTILQDHPKRSDFSTSTSVCSPPSPSPSTTSVARIPTPSSPIRRKPLPPTASPFQLSSAGLAFTPSNSFPKGNDQFQFSPSSVDVTVRDLDKYPRGILSPRLVKSPTFPRAAHSKLPEVSTTTLNQHSYPQPGGGPVISVHKLNVILQQLRDHKRSFTMALHPPSLPANSRPPPLRVDSGRTLSNGSLEYKHLPKTPGSKITSFFGWKTATSPGNESTSTEISDSILSPLPSPMNASTQASTYTVHSRDSFGTAGPKMGPRSQTVPIDSNLHSKLADMENELREISAELAGSIRREMELEDMIELLQTEGNGSQSDSNHGTSDYFSDSGRGSMKYSLSDLGPPKAHDVDKLKRGYEQELAQLRVDLSTKWQEERSRRQVTESHIQLLESQVSQFRAEKVQASNLAGKAKELEAALEDTRRRLTEERSLKDNLEDLLTGMRVELEQQRNERDQLQSRMQHDLQNLRQENATFAQARKIQVDTQAAQQSRIDSIAEEGGELKSPRISVGLSRSNSLARVPPNRGGLSRSGSLSRPSSMIGREREFKESLTDRLKDVETQRDALHQTVKKLLEHQKYQASQYEKRIRILETELGRATQSNFPRRRGYEGDVRSLREEIDILRRRADDALEQKWRCEKGLAGLKIDLDRAEHETTSLRTLLQEYDIPFPPQMDGNSDDVLQFHVTASSLEEAYHQLRSDRENLSPGSPIPNEFLEHQVHEQVGNNASFRARLSNAIDQGEREQKHSAKKINEMQSKLRQLEEALLLAQQSSEEEVAKHEQEINTLTESHNAQLLRAKNGIRSPGLRSPMLTPSPFMGPRSPLLTRTTSGEAIALAQVAQTEVLDSKVKELEKALRDADAEMEEVVSRMNSAQIQVAELQADREEALRETRRLQAEVRSHRQ
ncbi:hypothetical protein FQN57_003981 [Myotisia sp. PD_48]|nr:hypothetical protein FQN57_003981 [Myotisia sp. PD_48]